MIRKETYLRILGGVFLASSFLFFMLLDTQRRAHSQPSSKDEKKDEKKGDIFLEEIKQRIEKAKTHIVAFKEIFSNIKQELVSYHFDSTSTLYFQTKLNDGISLPFGYASFGPPAQGFTGFKTQIELSFLPKEWAPAIAQALSDIGLGSFVLISPAQEWLLKALLVIKDKARSFISLGEMIMYLTVLNARLLFTPGLDTFSKVLKSIAPQLHEIVDDIKFKKQEIFSFLDSYYSQVHDALGHQFPKKMISGKLVDNSLYKPNGSKVNDAQARWILFALFVRTFLFYAELKYEFDKTETGKKVVATIQASQSVKERLAAIHSYNQQLPGFEEVKTFVIVESARLLNRLQNTAYKNALVTIFDPVLQLFGFSVDGFLKLIGNEHVPPEPPAPSLSEKELQLLSLDDFDPESF